MLPASHRQTLSGKCFGFYTLTLSKFKEGIMARKKFFLKAMGGLLIGAFILGWGAIPTVQAESKILKLGVINPLTGPAAQWGLNTKCTMESLEKFFNDRGGITVKGQNYKIQMISADDKYTVAGGRAAGEKLIYTDKVDFLVGSFGAEPISGWAPLSTKEKKLAVIGGPTWNPKPEWPYIFRVAASDEERSEALCSLMRERFHCKSVLYIMTDDLVGKLSKEGAFKNEKKRGLEIKDFVLVPPGTKDFYPFLSKALKSNPEYLHCKVQPGSVALIIKQSRELGYKGYIGYPTSMPGDLEKWQDIAGVEASKGFVGIMVSPEENSPLGLEQEKYYEKQCPSMKTTDMAYSMGPHILLMAIEKAQSLDPDAILKVLRTMEFHSFHKASVRASGEKTYGIKNHMTVPVPYSTIVGKGQVKFLGSFQESTP
jgi:branched-chain amino acid transport system substrate-binding protein